MCFCGPKYVVFVTSVHSLDFGLVARCVYRKAADKPRFQNATLFYLVLRFLSFMEETEWKACRSLFQLYLPALLVEFCYSVQFKNMQNVKSHISKSTVDIYMYNRKKTKKLRHYEKHIFCYVGKPFNFLSCKYWTNSIIWLCG